MASFVGATQKCTVCEKTAYPVDRLAADNRVYHKACFRCHHCQSTLKLSNYCSFEGVLYCRPHYDQLYKRTAGSLNVEGAPKIQKPEKQTENENAKVLSNVFLGTKDKCAGCEKTVYPTERVTVNGTAYHKGCFKCSHGGCTISSANFITHERKLYCKHHHIQLFKKKAITASSTATATPLLTKLQNEDALQEGEAQEGFEGGEQGGNDDSNSLQGGNDDCNSLCETEGSIASGNSSPTCHENVSCSSPRAFVSESAAGEVVSAREVSDMDQQVAEGEAVSPKVSLSSEKERRKKNNRDSKKVLEKLSLQLLDKNGRVMPIQVKYKTSEKKKQIRKESVLGKNVGVGM